MFKNKLAIEHTNTRGCTRTWFQPKLMKTFKLGSGASLTNIFSKHPQLLHVKKADTSSESE